ncbi:MAG: hypothetical protein NZ765_04875 [Anaerolineae bacterium]|nr:hypothetical protein [Anaerolineae bacterium]MDW8070932.1 hypothetical protein [Anaerolineae bacterium]
MPSETVERSAMATYAMPFSRVELTVWAALALLAFITRLAGLGLRPLADAEAAQALVSWQLYQGLAVTHASYSPLLATANLITFALWGATEFTVRFVPALAGAFLALIPLGLRRYLGHMGAIAAGVLMCLSPAVLHLSRTLNGEILAISGAALFFIGLVPLQDKANMQPRSGVITIVAGLALMVIAAPLAYSMVVLLLTFGGALWLAQRGSRRPPWGEIIARWRSEIQARKSALITILIATFAAASGLLLNRDGLAMTVDQIGVWARGFISTTGTVSPTFQSVEPVYPALWLLGLYEPLTLLAALFGLGIALGRRGPADLLLVWWFCGGILLDALRPGRSVGEVLLVLWPATLLAGLALGKLTEMVWQRGAWPREGIVVAACWVVFAFAYIVFTLYTNNYGAIWQPLAAVGMFIVLLVAFWQWHGTASVLRGAALAVATALALLHIAGGVRLNYTPVADASQPLVRAAAGEGLRDLVAVLQFVSAKKVNDPYLVEVLASRAVGPAVEWQLRVFPNVRWVHKIDQLPVEGASVGMTSRFPEVVLTPEDTLLTDEPYAGQDFVVRSFRQPAPLAVSAFVRWYLLRESQPQRLEKVVLWVKQSPTTHVPKK